MNDRYKIEYMDGDMCDSNLLAAILKELVILNDYHAVNDKPTTQEPTKIKKK